MIISSLGSKNILNFPETYHVQSLIFCSTCVDEFIVCHGVPLCANKEDLQWCKETPFADWTPTIANHNPAGEHYLYCRIDEQPYRTDFQYQIIFEIHKGDGKLYQCLNRLDENPFKVHNESVVAIQEKWFNDVSTSCPSDFQRRCLGYQSYRCIDSASKLMNFL